MDLSDILKQLHREKERIIQAIAVLEPLQGASADRNGQAPIKRRGRKSMGAEERQEVSARMKRYWESRRAKTVT